MFNSPLLSPPNFKALTGGVFSYALLYWFSTTGVVAISHWWFPPTISSELKVLFSNSPLSTIFALVTVAQYFLPGFVAGFMARRAGLMHGLIIGTLLPVVTALFLFNELKFSFDLAINVLLSTLFLGLLFCSIAGVIGEAVSTKLWKR